MRDRYESAYHFHLPLMQSPLLFLVSISLQVYILYPLYLPQFHQIQEYGLHPTVAIPFSDGK